MATATRRRRKTTEDPRAALERIQSGFSGNDVFVIEAFAAAGIPPEEIDPRNNVLTFNAWKAKGRRVAKGATSLRVTVWIPVSENSKPKEGEEKKEGQRMYPTTARLFHVSQTIPEDAEKGTKPEAWQNPALVKEGTYEAEETPEQAPAGYTPGNTDPTQGPVLLTDLIKEGQSC